jgi:hypothetical protein
VKTPTGRKKFLLPASESCPPTRLEPPHLDTSSQACLMIQEQAETARIFALALYRHFFAEGCIREAGYTSKVQTCSLHPNNSIAVGRGPDTSTLIMLPSDLGLFLLPSAIRITGTTERLGRAPKFPPNGATNVKRQPATASRTRPPFLQWMMYRHRFDRAITSDDVAMKKHRLRWIRIPVETGNAVPTFSTAHFVKQCHYRGIGT